MLIDNAPCSIRITCQEVMGDYLMLGMYIEKFDCQIHETILLDWKSGELVIRIHSRQEAFLAFLNQSHIVIYSILPDNGSGSQRLGLSIYQIPTVAERARYKAPEDAKYRPFDYPHHNPKIECELPELDPVFRIDADSLALDLQSVPMDTLYSKATTLLFSHTTTLELCLGVQDTSNDEGLLHEWQPGSVAYYQVFVDAWYLLAQLEAHQPARGTQTIPWCDWGPQATRWFQRPLEEIITGSLHGSRYIGANALPVPGFVTLSLYDFNFFPVERRENISTNGKCINPDGRSFDLELTVTKIRD
jgi:hypothetical protein